MREFVQPFLPLVLRDDQKEIFIPLASLGWYCTWREIIIEGVNSQATFSQLSTLHSVVGGFEDGTERRGSGTDDGSRDGEISDGR